MLYVLFYLQTCKLAKTAEYRKFNFVSLIVARPEMVPERTPTARLRLVTGLKSHILQIIRCRSNRCVAFICSLYSSFAP